jgi:hypothetical protein
VISRLDNLVTWPRVRAYAWILAVLYVVAIGLTALTLRDGLDRQGTPFGGDFMIFYSASKLTLEGRPAEAYDPGVLLAVQSAVMPPIRARLLWAYPPTFQMLIAPLALTSYAWSLLAWLAATGAAYVGAVRLTSGGARLSTLLAVASPAAFQNAIQGQNGFLTTAILGLGFLLLDRRPVWAGAVLGLIVVKPHFGVLLPLVFAVSGRWRAFLGAACSTLLLVGVSLWLFGAEPWLGFAHAAPTVTRNLESGALPWAKMLSAFAALRMIGAPVAWAYAVHGALALGAAIAVAGAWRRPGPLPLKAGLAVCATLVIVPYGFDYDLALLAIPIAATAAHGLEHPLPPGVKAALALGFALPLLGPPLAHATGVNLTPVALVVLLHAVWVTLSGAAGPAAEPLGAPA